MRDAQCNHSCFTILEVWAMRRVFVRKANFLSWADATAQHDGVISFFFDVAAGLAKKTTVTLRRMTVD